MSSKKGGRFWAGEESSGSDSDSSDASDSSSDGELHGKIAQQNKANATKWIIEDDDDGDDEKRVVRTQEDKNSGKLLGHLKRVTNALKINDFNTIQEAWAKAVTAREKVNVALTSNAKRDFLKVLRKKVLSLLLRLPKYAARCSRFSRRDAEERTNIPITQIVIIMAVHCDDPIVFVEHRDNWDKQLINVIDIYKRFIELPVS